ncbi:Acyl-CoA thioesterase 2 [Sinobacterium norvegicum]|uniref:Acyl-CoA thioesterase 2 n=1 Tax=Sinobacterium norvegicum TaxID=1641715 RepID=A0ABM9AJI0_9GAMM|nr:acyl-CoA thioesterase II [Sinobacterium norvegicum]CAH0993392.1 Acyl-CoA thioesterase 2 [Sinobacterium norvegicum]
MATPALTLLLDHLTLQKLNHNCYASRGNNGSLGRLYGGEILAQSLSAADNTIERPFIAHSLHAHFLHLGSADSPLEYQIERLRDGRSFATRRVNAVQAGRMIFTATVSYHIPQPGFEHQDTVDINAYPKPESLVSEAERYRAFLPESMHNLYGWPIDFRQTQAVDLLNPAVAERQHAVWIKSQAELPDDQNLHRQLLTYCSDNPLLLTALRPHGKTNWSDGMQVASLDHAIWFHAEFRLDEWLLFTLDSPRASASRGLATGHIYNQQGCLVASVIQEGVMRKKP